MGRNAQLLLVTLTNTFSPFSIVRIFLYLLIWNAKARSNKRFRALEVKFSNTYYFSPTAPRREGKALGQVLACSPGKQLQYVNSAQPGRQRESHFSQPPTACIWPDPDNQKASCVSNLHIHTPHSELQSFSSADLNSPRALPRGPSRPMGCLCAPCWCWRWAHAPPQPPRCSRVLWFHIWH